MRTFMSSALVAVVLAVGKVSAAERGLAWGANNDWASALNTDLISWYHHWQDGPVPKLSSVEFVPMFWGPKYSTLWKQRQASFNSTWPTEILSFNEPDVSSQANLSPKRAASLHMSNLEQYRQQGIRVSSPQIVWNFTWMDKFLSLIRAQNSDVDFIALHWYGAINDMAAAKAYIQKAYKRYNKKIWITEFGNTASSGGTNAEVREFMATFMTWADEQSYIERVAYTGCFAYTSPPDDYLSNYQGFFNSEGDLRLIGRLYACNSTSCS